MLQVTTCKKSKKSPTTQMWCNYVTRHWSPEACSIITFHIKCTTNCCKLQLVKNPKSLTCPNVVQLHYKTQFQFRTWFMGQTQNISESWLKIFLNLANFYVDDSWVMQHVCTDPFIAWDSMLSYEYKNLKYLMSSVSFFFGLVGRNGK